MGLGWGGWSGVPVCYGVLEASCVCTRELALSLCPEAGAGALGSLAWRFRMGVEGSSVLMLMRIFAMSALVGWQYLLLNACANFFFTGLYWRDCRSRRPWSGDAIGKGVPGQEDQTGGGGGVVVVTGIARLENYTIVSRKRCRTGVARCPLPAGFLSESSKGSRSLWCRRPVEMGSECWIMRAVGTIKDSILDCTIGQALETGAYECSDLKLMVEVLCLRLLRLPR